MKYMTGIGVTWPYAGAAPLPPAARSKLDCPAVLLMRRYRGRLHRGGRRERA